MQHWKNSTKKKMRECKMEHHEGKTRTLKRGNYPSIFLPNGSVALKLQAKINALAEHFATKTYLTLISSLHKCLY